MGGKASRHMATCQHTKQTVIQTGHMVQPPCGIDTALARQTLNGFSCQEGHKCEMGLSSLDKRTYASQIQFCTCFFPASAPKLPSVLSCAQEKLQTFLITVQGLLSFFHYCFYFSEYVLLLVHFSHSKCSALNSCS